MVSPSKSCRHERKRSEDGQLRPKVNRSRLCVKSGPKPLIDVSFYLDINSHALYSKIESEIKELGGKIEVFLVNTVTIVVSDKVNKAGQRINERLKWDYTSGGSGGIPSLKSIEAPTPTLTPPTPYVGNEGPLSNSTNIRGQTTQRHKSRVDAMLERALTQPQQCSVDPLSNARTWGIPIWPTDKLQAWLEKIYVALKNYKQFKCDNSTKPTKCSKVTHLKEPYIKFEPYTRDRRPVFFELTSWPKLNFEGEPGSCPFSKKPTIAVKEIKKENGKNALFSNKEKEKEMTRRPRATATRTRRTELVSGYCEICRSDYKDLNKHLQSNQHLKFVQNNDNFLSLDNLIHTGASVEAFLKLNRSKNVNKDCKLYSNDESNNERNDEHNDERNVLTDDKMKKDDKSELDFNVEDIEMLQYNGARRELNLSNLNTAHNLRTRAKHESGHLLRSKGRSWRSEDPSGDKIYDKFEGFIIKKRAKGTIWLEEEEEGQHDTHEDKSNNTRQDNCSKLLLNDIEKHEDANDENEPKENSINSYNNQKSCGAETGNKRLPVSEMPLSNRMKINGYSGTSSKEESKGDCNKAESQQCNEKEDKESVICNGVGTKQFSKTKRPNSSERSRGYRGRRGGRSFRGRHRLSVEERLIEDNRAYYKVEVLGNKLRSSTAISEPTILQRESVEKSNKKEDEGSSEKPVVVRFKRVRKSELTLLSDEAESFMFREPKREDSSEVSEDEQSSVLPKDTETDADENRNSSFKIISSEADTSSKVEKMEEDSQDSVSLGRARKKRRTQAEALIMDNTDYYKFETPGSRLRYQAPLMGIKDASPERPATMMQQEGELKDDEVDGKLAEKRLSTSPSQRIEKMHFSFETVPKSETWYQTYQRQDEGVEYWHYFSESDAKPFLLPYEIENFREMMLKNVSRVVGGSGPGRGRRGRGRGGAAAASRSPRKSPRCHASTLAIMSTIIRKREQQQQTTNLPAIQEEPTPAQSQPEVGVEMDMELSALARNIGDFLANTKEDDLDLELDEVEAAESVIDVPSTVPKGPPVNLLDLLDNCHAMVPILEHPQSGASSDCVEVVQWPKIPIRRRKKKKRKNKTGWPGNRMRRKFFPKQTEEKITVSEVAEAEVANKELAVSEEATQSDSKTLEDEKVLVAENEEKADVEVQEEKSYLETQETIETSQNINEQLTDKDEEANEKEPIESNSESSNNCTNIETPDLAEKNGEEPLIEAESQEEMLPLKNAEFELVQEVCENSPVNDENHHKNVDNNRQTSDEKGTKRKRSRSSASGEDATGSCQETENEFLNNFEDAKRQNTTSVEVDNRPRKRNFKRRSNQRSRKRRRKQVKSSEIDLEIENDCKKDGYCVNSLAVNNSSPRKGVRKSKEQASETNLKERVTPTVLTPTELVQKRSSIEFQPVVRVMKIDESVDIEHGIRSVTVASNRRLRSSGSPKSETQVNRKRLKSGRGQLRRWIKSS